MQQRKQRCVQPMYVSHFACNGNKCGARCCSGHWNVQMTEMEYRKYSRLETQRERDRISQGICQNQKNGMYEFVHGEDGRCVFLQEDLLCSLQRQSGDGILLDICAEYPRKTYQFPGMLRRALCLSCPVAAELALSDQRSMGFEEAEFSPNRPNYLILRDDVEKVNSISFFDLQEIGIFLLQNRLYILRERLMLLGSFLDQAAKMIEKGEASRISSLGFKYRAPDFKNYARSLFRAVHTDSRKGYEFHIAMMRHMAEVMEDRSEDTRKYLEDIPNILDNSEAELRFKKLYAPLAYMVENYLVNEYFISICPCTVEGSFQVNYKIFMSLFKFLELALFAIFFEKRNLMEKDIVDAVCWLSARTNHYEGYHQAMKEYIEGQNMGLFEYMAMI